MVKPKEKASRIDTNVRARSFPSMSSASSSLFSHCPYITQVRIHTNRESTLCATAHQFKELIHHIFAGNGGAFCSWAPQSGNAFIWVFLDSES
jgi:hypothetical protein